MNENNLFPKIGIKIESTIASGIQSREFKST